MNYILMIANGITMTSAMVCTGNLYRYHWRKSDYGMVVISMMLIGLTALVTGLQCVSRILTALSRNAGIARPQMENQINNLK